MGSNFCDGSGATGHSQGVPLNYRQMNGSSVNAYSMINKAGKVTLVKFQWKPTISEPPHSPDPWRTVHIANLRAQLCPFPWRCMLAIGNITIKRLTRFEPVS